MRSILERPGLAAALLLVMLPVAAHHSRSIFDRERIVTIEGVVTKYEWRNPHVHVFVETETDSGDAVVWAFDAPPTTTMRRRGWSSDMLAPGDRVIVEGNPMKEPGKRTASLNSVRKMGVTFFVDDAFAAALGGSGSSPVKADGLSGVWEVPSTPLVDQFSDPATWPLTQEGAEALGTYDDRTMNPQIRCMARTAPWVMIFPGVHEIEVGDSVISIRTEYDTVERTVHMDAASHDGAAVAYQGHSIGRWEGEVLVVDTTHFSDHRNGNARGVQSGSQKHLVERFEMNPDQTKLIYRFQLDDLEHLAAPVTGELQLTYRPDLGFEPIQCDLEIAGRFLED